MSYCILAECKQTYTLIKKMVIWSWSKKKSYFILWKYHKQYFCKKWTSFCRFVWLSFQCENTFIYPRHSCYSLIFAKQKTKNRHLWMKYCSFDKIIYFHVEHCQSTTTCVWLPSIQIKMPAFFYRFPWTINGGENLSNSGP